jgi:hypothetical protein
MIESVEKKKIRFLEYFRDLPNQKLGASFVGVCEDTITDWKKKDSDFSDQVDRAKADWAMVKTKGVRNKEWLLERVLNDHFGQKTKTDVTSDGKALQPLLGGITKDEFYNYNGGKEISGTPQEN